MPNTGSTCLEIILPRIQFKRQIQSPQISLFLNDLNANQLNQISKNKIIDHYGTQYPLVLRRMDHVRVQLR